MYYDFAGYAQNTEQHATGHTPPTPPKEHNCTACGFKFYTDEKPVECPNCWDDVFIENFQAASAPDGTV